MEHQRSLAMKFLERMETHGNVTFLVGPEGEEEEVKASSFCLSTLSTVFEVMFNENWQEHKQTIKVPDIYPKIFRLFLKLLFTDELNESHLNPDDLSMEELIHVLYAAKKYDASSIQSVCRSSIQSRLDISNAVLAFEFLQNMNESELEKTTFEFIVKNAVKILEGSSFTALSRQSLTRLLICEELSVQELSLFKAVVRWAESECSKLDIEKSGENIRKILGGLLFLIRFPVMTIQQLYKIVRPLGILTPEEIVGISNYMVQKGDSPSVPLEMEILPFSSKVRPNVTSESLITEKARDFDHCFIYTPKEAVTLSKVAIPWNGTFSFQFYHYELKLCVSDGNLDILPVVTKSTNSLVNFSFDLEKTVTLDPGKTYFIYYSLKKDEVPLLNAININNASLTIRECPG